MSLVLHCHPLSSFCWKALIALYENGTPFARNIVDLADPAQRDALLKLWPLGKFPVLEDKARAWIVPESGIIIEYLAQHYPGACELVPADADHARQTRLRERFFDNYIHVPMQRMVADAFRPQSDPVGVALARETIEKAYEIVENDMAGKAWAMGDRFTMADCAAAPALYYGQVMAPLAAGHANVRAYLKRLMARPSFARVLTEAEPYFPNFPFEAQRGARIAAL